MRPEPSPPTAAKRTRRYGGAHPDERLALRRRQLLEAGLQVFGTVGFRAATVRGVCQAAGLTERYFYESFRDLAALYAAVYAERHAALMAAVQATAPSVVDAQAQPLDVVAAALRAFLVCLRDDPRCGRVLLTDALAIDEQVTQLSRAALHDYAALVHQHLTQVLPPARTQGLPLHLLSEGLVGLNVHLAAHWLHGGCREPLEAVLAANLLPYEGLAQLAAPPPRPAAQPAPRARSTAARKPRR